LGGGEGIDRTQRAQSFALLFLNVLKQNKQKSRQRQMHKKQKEIKAKRGHLFGGKQKPSHVLSYAKQSKVKPSKKK